LNDSVSVAMVNVAFYPIATVSFEAERTTTYIFSCDRTA
jgi:hypothetical protein